MNEIEELKNELRQAAIFIESLQQQLYARGGHITACGQSTLNAVALIDARKSTASSKDIESIRSKCPACRLTTLMVNHDGHLLRLYKESLDKIEGIISDRINHAVNNDKGVVADAFRELREAIRV